MRPKRRCPHSATGLLIGLLNIILVVVVLVLIGAVVEWLLRAILNFPVDPLVRRLYLGLVVIIAIVLLVRVLLGVRSTPFIGTSLPRPTRNSTRSCTA
jgi:hypothetical protein